MRVPYCKAVIMLVVAVTDAERLYADYRRFQYYGHRSNCALQQSAASSVISAVSSFLIYCAL